MMKLKQIKTIKMLLNKTDDALYKAIEILRDMEVDAKD